MSAVAGTFLVCVILLIHTTNADETVQPNIVFILADDLGFNGVGYHNPYMLTPNIDTLAAGGVKLESYYVQCVCSPSRAALLSGRYGIHTGLQHDKIRPLAAKGLPLEFTTIADELKDSGYATHMVGKWHIGHFKREYTPTHRGFDSFYGILSGQVDHYSHTRKKHNVMDLHDDEEVVWNNTEYSTHLFTRKAEDIIRNHNQNKPLFLYIAYQAPHAPYQVPLEYAARYPGTDVHAGMISCLDDGIGNVTAALQEAGMWDNTVFIFSTDNGADPHGGSNNNGDLRGGKLELWEGGIRGVGFIHAPSLNENVKGTASQELFHISDWFPTMLYLAHGKDATGIEGLDGYNQWQAINGASPSPRSEILHNIDIAKGKHGHRHYEDTFDTRIRAAIRMGEWKLITGNPVHRTRDGCLSCNGDSAEKNVWLFNIQEDPRELNDLSSNRTDKVVELLARLSEYRSTSVPPQSAAEDGRYPGGAVAPWM